MSDLIVAAGSCFVLGVMATLHPCPLAANVAAVSMLSGWSRRTGRLSGIYLSFIFGYLGTIVLLSNGISAGIVSIPAAADAIHRTIPLLLGPFLIVTGMLFADLLNVNRLHRGLIPRWMIAKRPHGFRAFPMGVLLALSFCPATAAIFFGLLIPTAIGQNQIILFPLIYAAGASLPLVTIGFLFHRGNRIVLSENWKTKVPLLAGWILIVTGIAISIQQIYLD